MTYSRKERREDAIALVRLAYRNAHPQSEGSIDLWLIRIANDIAPRITKREVERLEKIRRRPRDEEDSWGSSVR